MAKTPGDAAHLSHLPDEDFRAEVSNLAPAGAVAVGRDPDMGAGRAPVVAHADGVALAGRLSRGQRARRQVTAVGVVALALLVVLGSLPGVRGWAANMLPGAKSASSAALGDVTGYVYIAGGVPWATVAVDGHSLAHLPIIGRDLPLWLPPGRHTITWHAQPFAPVRCTISTPIAGDDTCPYDRVHLNQPGAAPSNWVITPFPSLATLPGDQRVALQRAAQTALDALSSSTTVQPGELYGQTYPPRVATQRLRATLAYSLVTDATRVQYCIACAYLVQDCVQFCTVPVDGSLPYWSVYVVVHSAWQFATLAGQPVTLPQSDLDVYGGNGAIAGVFAGGTIIPLRISWDGAAWHASVSTSEPSVAYVSLLNPTTSALDVDPGCFALQGEISSHGGTWTAPTDSLYDLVTWQYLAAPVRADGCVARATISEYTVVPTPSVASPSPLLLRRFGVVLAANVVAHRLWPGLPVADGYEKNMAAQIVAAMNGVGAGGNGSSR